MPNAHTPERQPGESQHEYRARQARSREAFSAATRPPMQAQAVSPLDSSRFFLGQHKASPAKRERRETVNVFGRRQALIAIKNSRRYASADSSDDGRSTRHYPSLEGEAA